MRLLKVKPKDYHSLCDANPRTLVVAKKQYAEVGSLKLRLPTRDLEAEFAAETRVMCGDQTILLSDLDRVYWYLRGASWKVCAACDLKLPVLFEGTLPMVNDWVDTLVFKLTVHQHPRNFDLKKVNNGYG